MTTPGRGREKWTSGRHWLIPRMCIPPWLTEFWVLITENHRGRRWLLFYWSRESFHAGRASMCLYGRRTLYAIHVKMKKVTP